MRTKKWLMRVLSLVIALVLVAPVDLLSMANALAPEDTELRLSIEAILGAVERGASDAVESYAVSPSPVPVTVVDQDGERLDDYVIESDDLHTQYVLDSAIGDYLQSLKGLPFEGEGSVVLREELLRALEGMWLVELFRAEGVIAAIDPYSSNLKLFVVNPSPDPVPYSLVITDLNGRALALDHVNTVIRRASLEKGLSEDALEAGGSRSLEVVAITETVAEAEVDVPTTIDRGQAGGGSGGSSGSGSTAPTDPTVDPVNPEAPGDVDPDADDDIDDLDDPDEVEDPDESENSVDAADEPEAESTGDASDEASDESAGAASALLSMVGRVRPAGMQIGGGAPAGDGDDAPESDGEDGDDTYTTVKTELQVTDRSYDAVVIEDASGRAFIAKDTVSLTVPGNAWAVVEINVEVNEVAPAFLRTQLEVTFDPNNGESVKTVPVGEDGKVAQQPNPKLPDDMAYFMGWFEKDADENAEPFDFSTVIEEDLTLVARYSEHFFVYFKNKAGGEVIHTQLVKLGEKARYYYDEDELVGEGGEAFAFWYAEDRGFDSAFNFGEVIKENLTLVAHYSGMYSVIFISEGTQVTPISVSRSAEEPPEWPAEPTRSGYVFSHWSLERDGAPYDTTKKVESDLILYAVWTKDSAAYQVVYWVEKPNLENGPSTATDYTFHKRSEASHTAQTGTPIGDLVIDMGSVPYAYFSHIDSNHTEVMGNGTTVVNLYYNLTEYTLRFNLNPNRPWSGFDRDAKMEIGGKTYEQKSGNNTPSYQFTAKVGQNIEQLWPTLENATITRTGFAIQHDSFAGWADVARVIDQEDINVSKRLTLTPDLLPSSGTSRTYYARWQNGKQYRVNYYFEQLMHEDGGALHNGKYYVLSSDYSQTYMSDTSSLLPKAIEGLEVTDKKAQTGTTKTFYYTRNRSDLTFNMAGGSFAESLPDVGPYIAEGNAYLGVMYGEKLSSFKPDVEAIRIESGTTYELVGWYYDAAYDFEVDFDSDIMPNGGLVLFAKWISTDNTAYLYNTTRDTTHFGYRHIENGVVDLSDFYRPGDEVEGYGTFLGWQWYIGAQLFDFSTDSYVVGDIHLYAKWKTEGFRVTYSLGQIGGTDVEGNPPLDEKAYLLGVKAPVLPFPEDVTLPDGMVFVGWQPANSAGGVTYHYGSRVTVNGDIQLVARYVPTAQAVTLTLLAGYEGGPTLTISAMPGDTVPLPNSEDERFLREAHTLVGWYDEDTGDDFAPGALYKMDDHDVVLRALWNANNRILTFQVEGEGTLEGEAVQTVPYGTLWSDIAVPKPVAKEGHYFVAWDPALPTTNLPITQSETYTARFAQQTELIITAGSDTKVYDGTPLTVEAVDYTPKKLGDNIEITASLVGNSITDVGKETVSFAEGITVLEDTYDVTDRYDIKLVTGELEVTHASLTVTADSPTIEYGDELKLTYTPGELVNNEKAEEVLAGFEPTMVAEGYEASGGAPGTYKIIFTEDSPSEFGNYAISYAEGELTVKRSKGLKVKAESVLAIYNGEGHAIDVAPMLDGEPIEADSIQYRTSLFEKWDDTPPELVNVGIQLVYYKVELAGYQTVYGSALITVVPRPIVVQAGSASEPYTGEEITVDAGGHVVKGGLDSETVTITSSGTGKALGLHAIHVTEVSITDGEGNSTTGNYLITKLPGVLLIHRSGELDAIVKGVDEIYDGNEHQITVAPTVEGATVEYRLSNRDDWSENNPVFKDVTRNQTVYYRVRLAGYKTVEGSALVNIKAIELTIKANKADITYGEDFTPTITYNGYDRENLPAGALADGFEPTIVIEGYEENNRLPGKYPIKVSGPDYSGNSEITYADDLLTVKESKALTAEAKSVSTTYDGKSHNITVVPSVADAAIQYKTTLLGDWEDELDLIDVGIYPVYYKVELPGYKTVTGLSSVTIWKRTINVQAENAIRYYTGEPILPDVDGKTILGTSLANGEVMTLAVKGGATDVGVHLGAIQIDSVTVATADGKDTTGNYWIPVQWPGSLTILPSKALKAEAKDVLAVYNGEARSISVKASVNGSDVTADKIEYKTALLDAWSDNNPALTDVGVQIVYYKVSLKNYEPAYGWAFVTVTPRPITVKAGNAWASYTGEPITVDDAGGKAVLGLVQGQTATITSSGTATDVGFHPNIHVTGVSITDRDGKSVTGNYFVTKLPGVLTIALSKSLKAEVKGVDTTYDGESHAIEVLPMIGDKVAGGATVAYSLSKFGPYREAPYTYTDVTNRTIHYVVSLKGYEPVYGSAKVVIKPAPLTITANDEDIIFGSPAPVLTAEYEGFVPGETPENALDFTPTLSVAYTAGDEPGTYVIKASGKAKSGNYTITYVKGQLTVRALEGLTVVPGPVEVQYDGKAHGAEVKAYVDSKPVEAVIEYRLSPEDAWTTNIPTYTDVMDTALPVYYQVQLKGYDTITGETSIKITPAPLTITADAQEIGYGAPAPALTFSYGELVNGEKPEDALKGFEPKLTTDYVAGNAPGVYDIVFDDDNPDAFGNYAFTYVEGKLTVRPLGVLKVEVESVTVTYDGTAKTIKVEPSVEGAAVQYRLSEDEAWVDTHPTVVDVTTETEVYYRVSLDGYDPVDGMATITIDPAPLTIMADNKAVGLGDPVPTLTYTLDGLVNGERAEDVLKGFEPTLWTTYVQGNAFGTYDINFDADNPDAFGNYKFTYVKGKLTVQPVEVEGLEAEAKPVTAPYDGTAQSIVVEVTVDGKPVDDATIRYSLTGNGVDWTTVNPTFTDAMDEAVTVHYRVELERYKGFTGSTTVQIAKRPVTVRANGGWTRYTGSVVTPTGGALTEGTLVEGHAMTVVTSGGGSSVGSYTIEVASVTITADDLDMTDNYAITTESGLLTIDRSRTSGGSTGGTGGSGTTAGGTVVTISDSGVPLADAPVIAIEDEEVPLAELPDTGGVPIEAFMALGAFMMGGAGLYKLYTGKRYRFKKHNS